MALAATPVDAELARPPGPPSLLGTITPVVDGSDYETPDILAERLDSAPETPSATRDRTVRWVDGYEFYPDDCSGGHIVDPCGSTDGTTTDSVGGVDPDARATKVGPIQPFIIEATDFCVTLGEPFPMRLERAQRKLLAVRSEVLAAEWWKGTAAIANTWSNNQYLANASGLSLPTGGNALGYVSALAELEQAISDGSSWQKGVIHCTPRVASVWSQNGQVVAVPMPGAGGVLRTQLGTLVAADGGYDGSGPTGGLHAAHVQWAYATGIPQIRLGKIDYLGTDEDGRSAVDTSTNIRTIRCYQFASIAITPCIRAAVLVNLTTALSVPGS